MYTKLREHTEPGYFIIADSAFLSHGDMINKIRTPLKEKAILPDDLEERENILSFNSALVSQRQSVEWGMRQLQGAFGRLRVPLDANDAGSRTRILRLCCRLHQLRCRLVGLNQIRNVYLPCWIQAGPSEFDEFSKILFSDIRKQDRLRKFYFNGL